MRKISRRAALSAVAIAPIAVSVPLVAGAIAEATVEPDTRWREAVIAYRTTYDALNRACIATDRVETAFDNAKPDFPILKCHMPVPDDVRRRVEESGKALYFGNDMVEISEASLRLFERDGWFPEETKRLRRCIADHHAEVARLRVDLDAAEQHRDAIGDLNEQAINDLINTPAPNLAALIEKVEIIRAEYNHSANVDPILADLKRLAGTVA